MRVNDGAIIRLPQPISARVSETRRPPQPARSPFVSRWLGRREPTLYERCLAVHIYNAGPRSALS